MENTLREKQAELTALLGRLTAVDGNHPTAIEPLTLHRLSAPSPPAHGVLKPTFCLVAQGSKLTVLGEETHTHDSLRFLLLSVDLPLTVQVTEASPDAPYLGLCLDIDPRQIGALLLEMEVLEMAADAALPAANAATTRQLVPEPNRRAAFGGVPAPAAPFRHAPGRADAGPGCCPRGFVPPLDRRAGGTPAPDRRP